MTRSPLARPALAAAVLTLVGLSACGSLQGVADNKIDYRGTKIKQSSLDVPPDLTQLSAEAGRFQPQGGVISATNFQSTTNTPAAAAASSLVAPQAAGLFRIERSGNVRWLATSLTAEQLWPQLQAFFKERGMTLVVDQPDVGTMETEWAENRAKLSNDIIRRTLGRVLDSLYSTGERDKFRVRVERVTGGSEVFITHKGMEEIYSGTAKETTVWQARARDPQLEADMLSRVMLRLGATPDQARTAEASAAPAAAATATARARVLEGRPAATLQVDDGFDRAWRRVGLALDRSGFTVEDRDRAQGVYFVRYVDPAQAGKEEPGFFSRIFSSKDKGPTGPVRYRVTVQTTGDTSTVSVQNAQGAPENGEAGQRIVALLVQDLK